MPRRWNWDFEDGQAAARRKRAAAPASAPRPLPTSGGSRVAQVRRRRGAAILVLIALLALLVAALSGASHNGSSAAAGARKDLASARHARNRAPSEPENEEKGAVASVLAYTPFVREGSSRTRDVALTFDDGPGPYTPEILTVLERNHVHATFFEVGKMLRYFSVSTVREIEDGDVVGDHTESHPMLAQLSAHDQKEQLFEQIARIELLGGKRPDLFRPPYGSFNSTTLRELRALHLLMVLWSADTNDYARPGTSVIVERALAGAHPGAIILMHDGGGDRSQTVAALPQIISGIRARGLRLVTVPRLLMEDPPPAGQQLPTNLSGG